MSAAAQYLFRKDFVVTIKAAFGDSSDHRFMRIALRQARLGRGAVEPNPMVGAVLVKNGRVIARGWHQRFGGPHAEIEVLKKAGNKARGGTLYVTLEPCCHTGKTGPCTKAIITAGISRVVAAMLDPNPKVCGKGLAALARAGINVARNVCRDQAVELNRPFIKWITRKQPYVIAKWAQSLDGCIADRHGRSKWISGDLSRQRVHALRSRVDAIMVGIGTALADDPLLTARPVKMRMLDRIALRVVLDSECRLPLESNLVRTCGQFPVLLVHGNNLNRAAVSRQKLLQKAGIQLMPAARRKAGSLALRSVLGRLARMGCTNILVEGGPRLIASLLRDGLIDETWVFIAPIVLGDALARHAVESAATIPLASAHHISRWETERLGPDVLIRGWL